jgi:hypothetical protein
MGKNSVSCNNCGKKISTLSDNADTVWCPSCGEAVKLDDQKQEHEDSIQQRRLQELSAKTPVYTRRSLDLGFFFILIPAITILLLWFSSPILNELKIYGWIVIAIYSINALSTAILASVEIKQSKAVHSEVRGSIPGAWLFVMFIIWPVSYPVYLYHRRKYGHKNMLPKGLLISLVLTGTAMALLKIL